MKNDLPLLFSLILMISACQKEALLPKVETIPSAEIQELAIDNSDCTPTCMPPVMVDTSCIQMQMTIDDIPYQPIANYSCIVYNFAIQMEQLWISGSLIPANKAVTLRMPLDVQPGNYPIVWNTLYDAFYIPSIGADNFLGTSGNLFIEKHDTVNNYILGGFDFIAENLTSPVLPIRVFKQGCFAAHY